MINQTNPYLDYYLRKDVQRKILKVSKNKEVAVLYLDHNFGKRPDILQFESDIGELAKNGAVSFHISEENWKNPLQLKTGMSKKELDDLRIGWDLVLDVDSKFLEYSKTAASLVIDAIKFHDINNISIKYSGNNGLHIGIPFKAFPEQVNNINTRLLFPGGLRSIALYIKDLIKEHLTAELLKYSLDELSKNAQQEKDRLLKNGKLNPFSVVDIDTALISSRHLFRAPYSINEKSGLVSIPITEHEVKNFNAEKARPENVKAELDFLEDSNVNQREANRLIIQSFDYMSKFKKLETPENIIASTKVYEENTNKIPAQFFPGCIKKLLEGNLSDGKKRAVFILINFFKSTGYSIEDIKQILNEWNLKNNPPLRQVYINAQLSWHSRQKAKILPPNCDHPNYYMPLGIKDPDEICLKCKNPVNYALRAYRNSQGSSTKKKRKPKKQQGLKTHILA